MEPAKVDPAKTKLGKEFKHGSPMIGCRIDPSGTFIFGSYQDNTLQRWEISTATKTAFEGHKSWARGLAFEATSKTLFSADWVGSILAWTLEADKPAPRWTVEAHKGWARAIVVSPDGKLLASCGNDGQVCLWSTSDGKSVRKIAAHDCHVYNVAFHPDGKHLVSGDLKGVIKQWEVDTGKMVRQMDAAVLYKYDPTFKADIGGVRSIAFSPDGSLLACAGITDVRNDFAGDGSAG